MTAGLYPIPATASSSSATASSSSSAPATAAAGSSGGPAAGILIGDRLCSEVSLTIDHSLIPEERLSPTPSMYDGLDLPSETDLRILGCKLIQAAGILLQLPQVAMATAQVLFHRFFYSTSFVKHSFEIVAMACINLASKIEEAPRRIRDVINVFHHLRQVREKRTPSPLILDQNYINTKNQVIKAERRVLKELGFCVHVKHLHKIIVMYLQVLECEQNQTLVQTAWNYMNDSLQTNVFVRFQPETIACASIYLAARALQIPLPTRPHWFLLFGATEEDIQDICIETLRLYIRKKPNYELLEKEVEKRKAALQEAKLKAKGLNPDGTPALSTLGGFSPASKPSSPREVKPEEKTPISASTKTIKKEPEDGPQASKSPYNGVRKDSKRSRNGRSGSRSRSRTRSRSRSHTQRRHNNRRSPSGTYSSRSRNRSRSHSESPRRHHNHGSPHLKAKHAREDLKSSNRHGHKRKKSRSPSQSKSRDHSDVAKKHRHERGHHRERRERSRSFERAHKGKHHGSNRSAHGRHRR
ncbi:LOW QUALITY PROTEIN: cyclin-L1-like [Trichosurus vulpecula]|uniref:LOW QUALITY PROTEIN: cyclin-L1-like n=1 Tax=Trichosurus vulpecula TaxID=9337 RepID=UPI00186B1CC7|nr:LOW QUALITY PROTEIN: cyclin-L1-like [Trichosurus vulpecula]